MHGLSCPLLICYTCTDNMAHPPLPVDVNTPHASQAPPRIHTQFFYNSLLPIDDPLSPLPPLPTTSTTGLTKPPRPFSFADSCALEAAWLELQNTNQKRKSTKDSKEDSSHGHSSCTDTLGKHSSHKDRFSRFLGAGKDKAHNVAEETHKSMDKCTMTSHEAALPVPTASPIESTNVSKACRPTNTPNHATSPTSRNRDRLSQGRSGDDNDEGRRLVPIPTGVEEARGEDSGPALSPRKSRNPFHRKPSNHRDTIEAAGKKEVDLSKRNASNLDIPQLSDFGIERPKDALKSRFAEPIQPLSSSPQAAEIRHIVENVERDISGSPFLRALGERDQPGPAEDTDSDRAGRAAALQPHLEHYPELVKSEVEVLKNIDAGLHSVSIPKHKGKATSVPVGLSRLHSVEMPDLLVSHQKYCDSSLSKFV